MSASNTSTLVNFQDAAPLIKERLPLSQLVREAGVNLKLKGREQVGLCPFHDESTPSFSVNDEKGLYFCRGECGARGDVISFFSEYHGVEPGEAIALLSRRLSINLSQDQPTSKKPQQASPQHKDALQEFHDCVAKEAFRELMARWPDPKDPITQYLHSRAITETDVRRYRLGFIPGDGPFHEWVGGLPLPSITQTERIRLAQLSGFLYNRQTHSAFQDRLLFPIINRGGRVCAFSGRVIPALAPETNNGRGGDKYRNSPETPLFDKSQVLYGLTPSQDVMRDPDTAGLWRSCLSQPVCYLVEGYTDVIAMGSAGFMTTAAMGTAVTEAQMRQLLARFDKLLVLMDGDQAGRKAMHKIMLLALPLLKAGQRIQGVLLSKGDDPDTLVQRFEHHRKHIKQYLATCQRITPEMVWFSAFIGDVETPLSVGDQVRIERALAIDGAPKDPLWRLALGRYVESRCGYAPGILQSGRMGRLDDDTRSDMSELDNTRFWLIRLGRAPYLILPLCRHYQRRWWFRDAVRGLLASSGEVPQGLRLIFRAAHTLNHTNSESLDDWPSLVARLLDSGYPSLWLQQWSSTLSVKTSSTDSAYQSAYQTETVNEALWSDEWRDLLDSLDTRLNDALHQAVIAASFIND